MQKEKLTRENIKSDLLSSPLEQRKDSHKLMMYAAVFLLLALLGIKIALVLTIIFGILAIIIFALALYYLTKSNKLISRIESGDFTVKKDELIEKINGYTKKEGSKVVSKPYKLCFKSGTKFSMVKALKVTDFCYHKWSKMYNLDCMGEFNHAQEGDIYYTVCLNNSNKCDAVYNSKLFDYNDYRM